MAAYFVTDRTPDFDMIKHKVTAELFQDSDSMLLLIKTPRDKCGMGTAELENVLKRILTFMKYLTHGCSSIQQDDDLYQRLKRSYDIINYHKHCTAMHCCSTNCFSQTGTKILDWHYFLSIPGRLRQVQTLQPVAAFLQSQYIKMI